MNYSLWFRLCIALGARTAGSVHMLYRCESRQSHEPDAEISEEEAMTQIQGFIKPS